MKRNLFIKMSLVLTLVLSLVVLTSCKKKFTVTFNSDGGSIVEAIEVKKGKTIEKPANPTKEGYTFVEWTLDGSTYNFETEVTENITLVAKWQKNAPQEIVYVPAPENVKMSETEVTWTPVANATGYVVYVNGNAKEVSKASISLSEIQPFLNSVDDVVCVVAKQGNSESTASTPIIKKGKVSATEINDLKNQITEAIPSGTQLQFTNEQLTEMVRTLKKYNISFYEVMHILNTIDTSTPEKEMKTLMELLNHPKLAALVELAVTTCFSYCDSVYDSFTNLQYPAFTQEDQNIIKIYYERIGMKVESLNSRLYNNVMVPWISSIASAINFFTDGGNTPVSTSIVASSIYTGTIMCGWYFTRIGFSATRDADTIQFTIGGQIVETTVTELRDNVMTIMNSIGNINVAQKQAFMKYFNNNVYPKAAEYLELIKPDFDDMAEKMKVAVNVYLPSFVEGVNNLMAMNKTIQSLTTALNEIAAQIQNLQTQDQIKALMASVNGFKNQAIDALVATLPTDKQWNAIMYFMNIMLEATEEGKVILEQLGYENITQSKEILLSLKEVDLTKYDIMPILAAMTNPTEETVDAAKQVVKQIITDIMAKMPEMPEIEPTQQPTDGEIASLIMAELENTEKTSFPVLSLMYVIFGKEIKTSNIRDAIRFVNNLATHIANYNFDKETITSMIQDYMKYGYLPSTHEEALISMLIDFAKEYVTEDVINEASPAILEMLRFVLPDEQLAIVKKVVKVGKDNLDDWKKIMPLFVKASFIDSVAELESFLDEYLAYIQVKENYDGLTKTLVELDKAIGEKERVMPTQAEMIERVSEAKKLVGIQKYKLSDEQITFVEQLEVGFEVVWAYPEVDCFHVEYDTASGNYLVTLDTTLLNGKITYSNVVLYSANYGSSYESPVDQTTTIEINPYTYMSQFSLPIEQAILEVTVETEAKTFYLNLDITKCFSTMSVY